MGMNGSLCLGFKFVKEVRAEVYSVASEQGGFCNNSRVSLSTTVAMV